MGGHAQQEREGRPAASGRPSRLRAGTAPRTQPHLTAR